VSHERATAVSGGKTTRGVCTVLALHRGHDRVEEGDAGAVHHIVPASISTCPFSYTERQEVEEVSALRRSRCAGHLLNKDAIFYLLAGGQKR